MYRKCFVFPLLCIIIIPKFFHKIKKDRHTASFKALPGGGGYITGSGLFCTPVQFARGLFSHDIISKFSVIVAEQDDFTQYR